ncbi:hypothetical protein [Blastopirellula marina]|nr:hypothetical protein [Blastopirellula marina]
MSVEPQMPDDWDDHVGWESYYHALPSDEFWFGSATTSPGSFSFHRLSPLTDEFREKNWMTVWFPGCGFSPLPRAFALLGFRVIASDVAPSAIEYQHGNASVVEALLASIESLHNCRASDGCLDLRLHDFRTPLGTGMVDVIFNIKSFQGLPAGSMSFAAQTHFAALRSGGLAFFDTINVQGERRDRLESELVKSGFYVPLANLNRWYRQSLAATEIPHMFVLGIPMIPQRDDVPYPHKRGTPEYERDVGRLRDLTMEFRSRAEVEYAKEQSEVTNETKHAHVIYSTG